MKETMQERIQLLKQALILEQKTELDRYRSLIEERPMKERILAGVTVYPTAYIDYTFNNFEDLILAFTVNPNQSLSNFSSNGKVQIFSSQSNDYLDGVVDGIKENTLYIQISEEKPPTWINNGKLGINALPDTKTTEMQLKTLDAILADEIRLVNQFYRQPTEQKYTVEELEFDGYNPSQNKALSGALSSNPFQIIHGPPGTGKTQTLVKIISENASNGKRVLVCAPTNAAVDHITKQLALHNVPLLRLGNSLKVDPSLIPYTLKGKILDSGLLEITKRLKKEAEIIRKKAFRYVRNFDKEAYKERKELRKALNDIRKDIRKIERDLTHACLDKAKVITGTFVALQTKLLDKFDFDLVVVDEAGQALEPAVWSVARKANQLVLAGDPFQLPPTLFTDDAVKLGLGVSLIEKGIELGVPTNLLDVQYRMNDKIMQFSNTYFYNGKLHSAQTAKNKALKNEEYLPIEFIDTAGCGYEEVQHADGGLTNPHEIDLIKKRIEELAINVNQLVVLSPYRMQVNLLRNEFADTGIHCQTIDSFQGQEKTVIIVSLVRSNDKGTIGFLSDYRRMNVALTRAEKKLIVIGDSATIGADSFYADFLNYIEKNGSYRTGWEFLT